MTIDTKKKKADKGYKSNHLAPYETMQLDTQQKQTCLPRVKAGGQEMSMHRHNNDNTTGIQRGIGKNPSFIKMASIFFI